MTIATATRVTSPLDPLSASNPATSAISRQIHEPLVFDLQAPLGGSRRAVGLALMLSPSPDDRVWTARLRRGVRFQDGSPLTAQVVVDNAVRWRSSAAGRRLVPGLIAADAPRTSVVRLVFDRAVPDLRRRLRSPRLGIAASSALAAGVFRRSGTGPFEVRERDARRVVMARNAQWWGRRLGLGPALDRLIFRYRATSRERFAAIRDREAQVALGLGSRELAAARRNPLFEVVRNPRGGELVLERSVRGVTPPVSEASLSEAWLTRVAR